MGGTSQVELVHIRTLYKVLCTYAVYSFSLTDTEVCTKLHRVSCGCNITASLVLDILVLYETYILYRVRIERFR